MSDTNKRLDEAETEFMHSVYKDMPAFKQEEMRELFEEYREALIGWTTEVLLHETV